MGIDINEAILNELDEIYEDQKDFKIPVFDKDLSSDIEQASLELKELSDSLQVSFQKEFNVVESSLLNIIDIHELRLHGSKKVNRLVVQYKHQANIAIETSNFDMSTKHGREQQIHESYTKLRELGRIKFQLEAQLRKELN